MFTLRCFSFHSVKPSVVDSMFVLSEEQYRYQLDLILEKFKVVSFMDLYSGKLEGDCSVICHDDLVQPKVLDILLEKKIKASFFVYTSGVGENFCLVSSLLRAVSLGHEICSHSVRHKRFSELPYEECFLEMTQSRIILERLIGVKPTVFGYPFGDAGCDPSLLKVTGYLMGRTTSHGVLDSQYKIDFSKIPCYEVTQNSLVASVVFEETTTKEYWNSIYAQQMEFIRKDDFVPLNASNVEVRTNAVLSLLSEKHKLILDVGSGYAFMPKKILEKFPEKKVVACDVSPVARDVSNYTPYLVSSGEKLPFKKKYFDLVICCQTIEFVKNPRVFLEEIKRVSQELILTTTDYSKRTPNTKQAFHFTLDSLSKLLSEFGFIETKILSNGMILIKVNLT